MERMVKHDWLRACRVFALLCAPLLVANCAAVPRMSDTPPRNHYASAPVHHARVAHADYSRHVLPAPEAKPRVVETSYEPTAKPKSDDAVWWQNFSLDGSSPDAQFLWPVKGAIVSPYGARPNGERNDGINIAAADGTPIRAAAAGEVTYVGNELKGYGNLVLIRHDNGYVTAYAHTGEIVVARGARVTQGQTIAYAGTSGDVSSTQLHFEIRHGTTPVDPKPLLIASR